MDKEELLSALETVKDDAVSYLTDQHGNMYGARTNIHPAVVDLLEKIVAAIVQGK